jgi:hypothetical protein
MSNTTSGDDQQPKLRKRMTRSVGLVLVGTAALMLGMPGGCDDHRDDATQGNPSTQPSGYGSSSSSSNRHYYTSGRRTPSGGWWSSSHSGGSTGSGGRSSSGASSHTSRDGVGTTGHHVAS